MNTSKNNFFVSGRMAYLEGRLAALRREYDEACEAYNKGLLGRHQLFEVANERNEVEAELRKLETVSAEYSAPVEPEIVHTPHHIAFIRSLMAGGSIYHTRDFHKALTGEDWPDQLTLEYLDSPWFKLGFGVALEAMMKCGDVEWWCDSDGHNYRLTVKALQGAAQ